MDQPTPLTRHGDEPNRAGRRGVSAAMRRLLEDGQPFTDVEVDLNPEELRSWTARLVKLSSDLADCVEAPMRNRIMEMLSATWIEDDANALRVIRFNIAAESPGQLGDAVGISGRTIERIESGKSCQLRAAGRLASHFSLRVTELFGRPHTDDRLRSRSVSGLREAMLTSTPLLEVA